MYGLPQGWLESVPWEVKLATQLYRNSGKQRIPTRQEIRELEPAWVSDILFLDEYIEFYLNDDPLFNLFEKLKRQRDEARTKEQDDDGWISKQLSGE